MTPPEVRLWVRFRRVADIKVRRQHPLGPFILDFFVEEAALCIEVDGDVAHDFSRAERDERRTAWLESEGVEVIRIPAVDVMRDPDGSAEWLIDLARRRVAERFRA